jgi:hypothetical protein
VGFVTLALVIYKSEYVTVVVDKQGERLESDPPVAVPLARLQLSACSARQLLSMVVTQRKARPSDKDRLVKIITAVVIVLGLLVGGGFLADYLSEMQARKHLLAAVDRSSGVILNGEPVTDTSVVLGALRTLAHAPSHHSSPTEPILLELLTSSDTVSIVIARDSERPEEFWVYRSGANWHNDPLGQDAGRVVSSDFDKFLKTLKL